MLLKFSRKIRVAGDRMHPQDYIIKLSLVTKVPAKVELVPPQQYLKMFGDDQATRELVNMFQMFSEYDYFGKRDWQEGRRVYPNLKTWEEYLRTQMVTPQSY
jgi:hypothetical protein